MRPAPVGNNTLLRIQQEISEVAARENELRRNVHVESNGVTNGDSNRATSPVEAAAGPHIEPATPATVNGTATRRFIPNTSTKGVMQKFFKTRGKIHSTSSLLNPKPAPGPQIAWQPPETISGPAKALIPTDKPLRKGYVPVEERIQKELQEMKNREEELKTIRRKSQPDLMAALESEQESSNPSTRSSSPMLFSGRLRPSRSFSHLLEDDYQEEGALAVLRPARSLAELCDAPDEDIESPRSLIQRWESMIRETQESNL